MTVLEAAPETVLAIYAHPDDPEVSCGGTLTRWSEEGATVHVVIATRGEKGSSDPATDPEELAQRRAVETAAALEVIGAVGHDALGLPDGEVENDAALRGRLVGLIRQIRPELVVTPDPTAIFFGDGWVNHRDHRQLGWAVLDAVAPAAASPLYFPEEGPPHQVGEVFLSGTLEPDVWVDVGRWLDQKVAALRCHRSQLGGSDDDWLEDFVRQRATDAGHKAGVAHAEAFRRLRLSR
jgi:LmbE family N-acetylglucosaminyl deacetylase